MRIVLALVVGLFVISGIVLAQEVAAPVEAAVETALTEAAPVVAAPIAATAQEITVKGRIHVLKAADGSVEAIIIYPEMGHGYSVDLQVGEGKTLADKQGKTVEVTGMDVNRKLQVKTIAVLD